MIGRLLLFLNTVRYLRPRQIIYRPIRMLQARIPSKPGRSAPIDVSRIAQLGKEVIAWGPGDIDARIARANEIVRGRFTFLNKSADFSAIPWNEKPISPLWSFNLHYFDYAVDLAWAFRQTGERKYLERFQDLFNDWQRSTRHGRGDAWAPYVVSVRVVNLLWTYLLLDANLDASFGKALMDSVHRQTVYLERRLEWHLLGNHLLKNLHALAVIGLAFEGPDAERWRNEATSRLQQELQHQVLADGGHFERSPMYHALILADLLELLLARRACGLTNPADVLATANRMVIALRLMSRASGELRLFNDSANGIAPPTSRLVWLAERLLNAGAVERRCWRLPQSGYYGIARANFDLMIDCGPPGPPYQPGHAHCDILSYELDYNGLPLIIDAGVSDYTPGRFREYARSTRAHNTLMIAENEQSEVWGSFRMGRRARVVHAELTDADDKDTASFAGAYRPYKPRGMVHHRTFFLDSSSFRVIDRVDGNPGFPITSYVHFHPDCRIERQNGAFHIVRGTGRLMFEPFGFASAELACGEENPPQGWYLPEFGVRIAAPVILLRVQRHLNSEFGYTLRV
ncbi:MAG TPA: alginate lyase family protein [Gemmatimonadaceae bacterium]|nr:alginate lyase family protein [Gemmatimonadaceae bacterium]